MVRKTKIVATVGPSSDDPVILRELIKNGMNVARLNFSHGTHAEHAERIRLIREISVELDTAVAILQDLQGPKLRVGILPPEGILLKAGQVITLKPVDEMVISGDETIIPLDVPNLINSVVPGNRILLDDGNLEIVVTEVKSDAVVTEVVLGGKLTSNKGVNLPGSNLGIPSFTQKDYEDLVFGLQQNIDLIAISFVSSAEDIINVRRKIHEIDPNKDNTPVIAKLERPQAIQNMDEIIDAADGVMVARGDLGVETSPAAVPIIQKRMIEKANQKRKLVITATQMLDSMIHNPRPTRAEASDVANAIFDDTDAVMLSGETASGKYPIKSISIMNEIILEAENNFTRWGHLRAKEEISDSDSLSITQAASSLAHDLNVQYIAVFTRTGRTALLMSKARPCVPILAFTPEKSTYNRLALYWGVTPVLVPFATTVETMLSYVETAMLSRTPIRPGQQVVVISSYPVGTFRPANLVLLHTVGKQTL